MKQLYAQVIAIAVMLLVIPQIVKAQNLGFEATPATTPPANWSATTGTWAVENSIVRTGNASLTITDPATTGTTIGNTAAVITTTAPGYLITIGWGRSNVASNAVIYLGYRLNTTNTLNPSSTSTGQAANLNNTTWTRITSVSSSSTVAAGNYGVSMRAFRTASTSGTTLYLDDIIIYGSSSNVPDLSAPNAATGGSQTNYNLSWTNGTDNGAPASGIGGVVIIRAEGTGLTPPSLNDQAMYSTTHGAAGVGSFVSNNINWTVVANISGNSTTTFNDATAGTGSYTYAVYMRDMAYNYSPALAISAAGAACTTPPTPGTATVSPSAIQCAGTTRVLGVTGNSSGAGQTYIWQSGPTAAGPWTNISSASSNPSYSVAPTATTHYRLAVTCGANTLYSVPVEVLVRPVLSGTYAINKLMPTSYPTGNNFASFADALSALCSGISSAVVFEVVTSTGPYNEQVVINPVTGSSATNTITFNGNGQAVQFASTASAERAVFKLDGADNIIINNFVINADGGTYGHGVQILNDADNNTVSNCTINTSTTSTSTTNFAGILINSTATAIVTSGDSRCDNNTITGNTINGGYVGIGFVADGATTTITGNKAINNVINDSYIAGILLDGNVNAVVERNDISRMTRANSSSSYYAINMDGISQNTLVSRNRIHDPFKSFPASTASAFGIRLNACDAAAGTPNTISNNLVYNFQGATGNQNGILNNSSDNVRIYYNTIVLDDAAASCACGARGIYVQTTTVAGLDIRNNIIFVGRGGSGDKQSMFFEPTSVAAYTINNNVHYVDAAAPGTGIKELVRVGGTSATGGTSTGGTSYATLVAWQATTKDANGSERNPLFTSSTNFTPTNSLIDNIGTPLDIVVDINGAARSATTPDPGAIEWTAPLPVTWLEFIGQMDGPLNVLAWKTATETNNKGFEVQRSVDGRSYSSIGFIASGSANGNSASTLQYHFTDHKPFAGTNFYRLKQLDTDGRFNFSNVVVLTRKPAIISLEQPFPNPVSDVLQVNIASPGVGQGNLLVTDLSGRILSTQPVSLQAGSNLQRVSTRTLAAGNYFLKLVLSDGTVLPAQQFIRQ